MLVAWTMSVHDRKVSSNTLEVVFLPVYKRNKTLVKKFFHSLPAFLVWFCPNHCHEAFAPAYYIIGTIQFCNFDNLVKWRPGCDLRKTIFMSLDACSALKWTDKVLKSSSLVGMILSLHSWEPKDILIAHFNWKTFCKSSPFCKSRLVQDVWDDECNPCWSSQATSMLFIHFCCPNSYIDRKFLQCSFKLWHQIISQAMWVHWNLVPSNDTKRLAIVALTTCLEVAAPSPDSNI